MKSPTGMFYAGVGSRRVPDDAAALLGRLASRFAEAGWTCRTGTASGCDAIFRQSRPVEVYGADDAGKVAMAVGRAFHPVWKQLTEHQQKLIARNTYQITGIEIEAAHADKPVFDLRLLKKWGSLSRAVLCWTPDGADGVSVKTSKETGGTGQAIRLAAYLSIPVLNVASPAILARIESLGF